MLVNLTHEVVFTILESDVRSNQIGNSFNFVFSISLSYFIDRESRFPGSTAVSLYRLNTYHIHIKHHKHTKI